VPAYSPYAVAEHAVALLLALNRKIPRANNRVHDLNFSLNGLVGFDLTARPPALSAPGKSAASPRRSFADSGCVCLRSIHFQSAEWAQQYGIEYTDPQTLASECDVISLHTPLTPETHHIIRRETLERMKPGADPDQCQPRRAHRHEGADRRA
jgi:D-lactate dehydrogenase